MFVIYRDIPNLLQLFLFFSFSLYFTPSFTHDLSHLYDCTIRYTKFSKILFLMKFVFFFFDFRWWAIPRRWRIQQRKSSSESAGGSSAFDRETVSSLAPEPPPGWTTLSSAEKVPVQDVPTGEPLKISLDSFEFHLRIRFTIWNITDASISK